MYLVKVRMSVYTDGESAGHSLGEWMINWNMSMNNKALSAG